MAARGACRSVAVKLVVVGLCVCVRACVCVCVCEREREREREREEYAASVWWVGWARCIPIDCLVESRNISGNI